MKTDRQQLIEHLYRDHDHTVNHETDTTKDLQMTHITLHHLKKPKHAVTDVEKLDI